ncbi:MAG: 2-hydroxyacyl-CoA dehydratase [Proteobacteria bacterium]|nr:2-hydroxyacyl-CoA dehydratase [Pseudomonadota bacterium]
MKIDIPSRIEVIREYKSQGGLVAAVFPIHYHRALMRAFNILPVEVWGPPNADHRKGDDHLQSYSCSIVRKGLSYIIEGGLDIVDIFIVPHCCDTLQGLGSILLDFLPRRRPVFPIYIPRGKREEDIEFLAKELFSLGKKLKEITGIEPAAPKILDAIKIEDEANTATNKLFEKRTSISFTNLEFYRLLRTREYLPSESYIELVNQALEIERAEELEEIPVLLSGVVPEPMAMFDILSDMNAIVVRDDFLSTGRRIYPPSARNDPWMNMAQSILQGPPDSTRGSSFRERSNYLVDLAKRSNARGVIFYHVKYCEPEQFYLPVQIKNLKEAQIPSISIEIDIGDPLSNQTITRIEAFIEMVS